MIHRYLLKSKVWLLKKFIDREDSKKNELRQQSILKSKLKEETNKNENCYERQKPRASSNIRDGDRLFKSHGSKHQKLGAKMNKLHSTKITKSHMPKMPSESRKNSKQLKKSHKIKKSDGAKTYRSHLTQPNSSQRTKVQAPNPAKRPPSRDMNFRKRNKKAPSAQIPQEQPKTESQISESDSDDRVGYESLVSHNVESR